MLRSLNTGISGLRAHQTMLDVTGNNIANVNTTGFKASRTQFADTLSQLIQAGVAPDQQVGGQNPAQVGLGVTTQAITTQFTQGATQNTGIASDLMIGGDGFFVVQQGNQQLYTRDGSFTFDAQGRLVTAGGAFVQGWTAVNGQVNPFGPVGNLTLPVGVTIAPEPTTNISFGGNLPAGAADGTELVRDIEVFDANGNPSILSIAFTMNAGTWEVTATDTATGTVLAGPQILTFTGGQVTGGGTLTAGAITIDLGAVTGYAEVTSIEVSARDGSAAGTLESYSISGDGSIIGTFSNGNTQVLGQIATATFANPQGLEKLGGNLYAAAPTSGDPQIGAAGQNGRGAIISGALEGSNVDLSQEFTNLIVAQRGFQASSRVVTTSDEVLGELMQLKR